MLDNDQRRRMSVAAKGAKFTTQKTIRENKKDQDQAQEKKVQKHEFVDKRTKMATLKIILSNFKDITNKPEL